MVRSGGDAGRDLLHDLATGIGEEVEVDEMSVDKRWAI